MCVKRVCMYACTPRNWEILVCIYKRIPLCCAEFLCLSQQKKKDLVPKWGHGEFIFFVQIRTSPLYQAHTPTRERVWKMYGVFICYNPHPPLPPITRLFHHAGFCVLVSESLREVTGAEEEGQTLDHQMLQWILWTLPDSFSVFPSLLHPFLPLLISWAVEITCPLARAHHQSHDSLRVPSVMAGTVIESRGRVHLCLCLDTILCAWEMTSK